MGEVVRILEPGIGCVQCLLGEAVAYSQGTQLVGAKLREGAKEDMVLTSPFLAWSLLAKPPPQELELLELCEVH